MRKEKGMKIKGEYRSVLSRKGEVIMDTCWKSNDIVEDYGRFMAALMKKDFKGEVEIDYMAVVNGITKDKGMELTRSIILTFPIEKEGVS